MPAVTLRLFGSPFHCLALTRIACSAPRPRPCEDWHFSRQGRAVKYCSGTGSTPPACPTLPYVRSGSSPRRAAGRPSCSAAMCRAGPSARLTSPAFDSDSERVLLPRRCPGPAAPLGTTPLSQAPSFRRDGLAFGPGRPARPMRRAGPSARLTCPAFDSDSERVRPKRVVR